MRQRHSNLFDAVHFPVSKQHSRRNHHIREPAIAELRVDLPAGLLRSEHHAVLRANMPNQLLRFDGDTALRVVRERLQQLHQRYFLLQLLRRLPFQQQPLHPDVQFDPQLLLQRRLHCRLPVRHLSHERPDYLQQLLFDVCYLQRLCNQLRAVCWCLPIQRAVRQQVPHQLLLGLEPAVPAVHLHHSTM